MKRKKPSSQLGSVFPMALIALTSTLVITLVLVSNSFTLKESSRYSLDNLEVTLLAEAGIEKAVASLNKSPDTYIGETETFLGDGSYSVSITSIGQGIKQVDSTGYIPNKSNPKTKRQASIKISQGTGISFNYGVQVGEGGLELGNGNEINGSIYSNGNILAKSNNNTIYGDAWVAEGLQLSPDQESICSDPNNCFDYIFGKNVSGENRIDVAQSFKPAEAETNVLNKVEFYIKKAGSPTDATVRLATDNNGKPNKNNILASGVLYSERVTSNYGWIDVTFNTPPQLTEGNTYWLFISTNISASDYWIWELDNLQSYGRGVAKWSPDWQAGNPTWNLINGDLNFKTYMGGVTTSIKSEANNFTVTGDVHANTIDNITIQKDAYYKYLINSTVGGESHSDSTVPPPKIFPISDANIIEWKDQADGEPDGTNVRGGINDCVSTLGPIKVEGDVEINSNCIVNINSPVWITGNLTLNSHNELKLNEAYGTTSGVIVVDGRVEIGSNNKLEGTGVGSSILMVLSSYDSRTSLIPAIVVNNEGNNGVYYAKDGIIEPGNKNNYTELTAWGIRLINNSKLNYLTGLSSTLFSGGPSGSYSVIKGTYQIK